MGGALLFTYWLVAIYSAQHNVIFAYETWWHAPVGTIELFIVLVSLTPMWVWTLFRFWNWQGYR